MGAGAVKPLGMGKDCEHEMAQREFKLKQV